MLAIFNTIPYLLKPLQIMVNENVIPRIELIRNSVV